MGMVVSFTHILGDILSGKGELYNLYTWTCLK